MPDATALDQATAMIEKTWGRPIEALESFAVRSPSEDPLLRSVMHIRSSLVVTDNAVAVHQDRLHALSRPGRVPAGSVQRDGPDLRSPPSSASGRCSTALPSSPSSCLRPAARRDEAGSVQHLPAQAGRDCRDCSDSGAHPREAPGPEPGALIGGCEGAPALPPGAGPRPAGGRGRRPVLGWREIGGYRSRRARGWTSGFLFVDAPRTRQRRRESAPGAAG